MANITMITSGKGGVGKSVSCVMLGAALSRLSKKVLIIELDSGLGSLDMMMGLEDRVVYNISDVLEGICEPKKAIFKYDHAPSLYLMPATSYLDSDISVKDISKLCRGLAGYFDYILLDTPAGIGPMFKAAALAADSALIVVTPEPISVRDSSIICNLILENHIDNVKLIINRVKNDTAKSGAVSDLDSVIDDVGAGLIGVVPENGEFAKAMSNGDPLNLNNIVSQVYDNIAKRMLGQYAELLIN